MREYVGHTWERQGWENDAQYGAFLLYRGLGVNRSIDAAYKGYSQAKEATKSPKKPKKAQKSPKKTPKISTSVSGTFKKWAKDNEWSKRAADYDVFTQRALDEVELETRKNVVREYVEKIEKSTLDALLKMLENPSVEKVRKKYKVERVKDKDIQQLVEVITEQQSVFAATDIIKYVLERRLPEFFSRIDDDDEDMSSKSIEELQEISNNKQR